MKIKILILLSALFLSGQGFSADVNGESATRGLGNYSCEKFTVDVRDNQYAKYLYYSMGYYSGINAFVKDTYDIQGSLDLEGTIGFLAKYCEENPLKQFSLALDSLVIELFPNRIKLRPK